MEMEFSSLPMGSQFKLSGKEINSFLKLIESLLVFAIFIFVKDFFIDYPFII